MNNFESAELITPVILSGGAGSRMWPMSREKLPKQFLPLLNGRTLFDLTLDRVSDVTIFSPPLIVSSANSVDLVSTSLERSSRKGRIILEPLRRDWAAAIAVAVATIMQIIHTG